MAKKKHLILRKRPCSIGNSINTRGEMHGEESVPGCDIPLSGLRLEEGELNALVGDEGAYDALFVRGKKGELDTPRFKDCKPLQLMGKFDDCAVTFFVGADDDNEVAIGEAKLGRIVLEPELGGLTAMSVQVQGTPPVDDMARLIAFLNGDIEAKLTFGKKAEKSDKQKDLDLGASSATSGEDQDA